MKKFTVTALSLIVALAAGSAIANEHGDKTDAKKAPHKGHQMMKHVDTNNDGTISKDEWDAKGDKMFEKMDANNDGELTKDEMKTYHSKKREAYKQHRGDHKGGKPSPDVAGGKHIDNTPDAVVKH